jgi:hypothetical protein
MFSLSSLFAPRRRMRTFALLDQAGLCRAFRQSRQAPLGAGWVEVDRQCLSWLQKPLPASARIATNTNARYLRKALPA